MPEPTVVDLDNPDGGTPPAPAPNPAPQPAPEPAPAPQPEPTPAPAATPPADPNAEMVKAAEAILAQQAAADQAANDAIAPVTEPQAEPQQQEYVKSSSEAGQAALDLMQAAGVSVDDAKAAMQMAMKTGKPEDINMEFLRTKMTPQQATLVEVGLRQELVDARAKVDAAITTVHDAVGGKDVWGTITTWAQTADATVKAEIAELKPMFQQGGVQAKLAAQRVQAMYNASSTTSTPQADQQITQGDAGATVQNQPLSRDQYLAERKAVEANGALTATHREALIGNLKVRRQAGRVAGI